MGLVQYLVIVLMLYAQVVLTSPLAERSTLVTDKKCKMCSAGEFQKSCTECEPCPAGSFTNDRNSEDSCHRCFGDCRSVATAPTPGNDKQTPSSVSSGHTITSAKPCQFSECQQSVPPTPSADAMSSQLAAILGPLAIMGCLALVILFCVCHQGDETCFKQAIAKICNEGKQDASHKSKESSHQFPRDSFCAKQQPPSLSAANLGSVHVHNPGTVIFSLLSQFTGQVGATIEGGKAAETVGSEEEDERDCPVCHPTSSPSIHLSEEERSGEIDSIFFPSQEQGKDCHMSKEEEL
ncbi:uncharacterized protein LOC111230080 isoform X2 [Seriola dumerili]|uniref:uncharacterized protein LOC111230080 isoform X2 n=1 Tax=Seriola dumerili TaxID=41447 RepID=UPI000BBEFDBF|nr:uncharacterized protein LOC111230080 isoform X2 [Seriola dumerili]